MEQSAYTPEQEIVWCKTLIHHEAMTLFRHYRWWARDEFILNSLNKRDGVPRSNSTKEARPCA